MCSFFFTNQTVANFAIAWIAGVAAILLYRRIDRKIAK